MRMGARVVREQKGRIRDYVDKVTLPNNEGLAWSETSFAKLTAQAVGESTDLIDNPQQLTDALISIQPSDSGIHILYTDVVADRVIAQAAGIVRSGMLGMNAILRKQDIDAITQGRSATTDLGNAGNPLQSATIRHMRYRISSNVTEPNADGPFHFVHHGFALADIDDELTAPIGTYPIEPGLTGDVFEQQYIAQSRFIGGIAVHEDGNMSIDSNDDYEGFGFAKDGLIDVEDSGPRTESIRRPSIGGGATSVYMYFRYAFGFRSSGNWLFGTTADCTAPA